MGESGLPHLHWSEIVILYLSLGIKDGGLSGRQFKESMSRKEDYKD